MTRMASPDIYPRGTGAEVRDACLRHLRDLRRAHKRGAPADVLVKSRGPRFMPIPTITSGMGSPAQECADFV
jgi:hypothetical protein